MVNEDGIKMDDHISFYMCMQSFLTHAILKSK